MAISIVRVIGDVRWRITTTHIRAAVIRFSFTESMR